MNAYMVTVEDTSPESAQRYSTMVHARDEKDAHWEAIKAAEFEWPEADPEQFVVLGIKGWNDK